MREIAPARCGCPVEVGQLEPPGSLRAGEQFVDLAIPVGQAALFAKHGSAVGGDVYRISCVRANPQPGDDARVNLKVVRRVTNKKNLSDFVGFSALKLARMKETEHLS